MIENQIGLLHEMISSMAKKVEEEKKELEGSCIVKDAEIEACKQEMEKQLGQMQSDEIQIAFLTEQLHLLQEENLRQAAEVNGLKTEIEEIKKVQKEEFEYQNKLHFNDMAKEVALIENQIRGLDQKLAEERMKWREALRSN